MALSSAYSIAVGLDRSIRTLTKLHCDWNRLSAEYEQLLTHWQDQDAEERLEEIIKRARDASEIGTEMPYDQQLLDKWEKLIFSRFQEPATT